MIKTIKQMKNTMNLFRIFWAVLLLFTFYSCTQNKNVSLNQKSQTDSKQMPHLEKQGTATRLVVEGKPFLMISGELNNSTCGGFDYMRPKWEALAKKNLNSVIATVSWELIEPEEGKFDFALVDSIIAGARKADLKLGLIWFASWKNGSSVYAPEWVKKDYEKYPRVKDENGKPLDILSTFGDASANADAKAFAALMRHIKEVDSEKQTVVMIQVENEMGVVDALGTTVGNARRDFSDPANMAFHGPVPQMFIDYLVKHKDSLFPELYKVWSANGFKTSGSWEEVFGKGVLKPDTKDWQFYSYYTEELFMAWNYARYVEKVASSGKKEYPLPMYVNAWLKQPFSYWPGKYPSGGPLPQVLDVWRAANTSIDFIAPDIYMDEFGWVCQEYTRNGNPLFIPETRGGEIGAARVFYVFGQYNAGCFAPFGIDDIVNTKSDPLEESYAVLQNMSAAILEHQGNGTMKGILVDKRSPVQRFELGDYIIEARFAGGEKSEIAGGLIIQTGKQEYICAGKGLDVLFIPKNDSMHIALGAVYEGTFKAAKWINERRLNGDEIHTSLFTGTGLRISDNKVSIQKVSLYMYK
jgi:beta-galactosidase GanA